MKTSHLADMLTRLRNGQIRNKKEVCLGRLPKFCKRVLDCLVEDGWLIRWYFKENETSKKIEVWASLKFYSEKPTMRELIIISKPRRRVYISLRELSRHPFQEKKLTNRLTSKGKQPFYLFNSWVLSTSKGVVTGNKALELGVGGELLCCVR